VEFWTGPQGLRWLLHAVHIPMHLPRCLRGIVKRVLQAIVLLGAVLLIPLALVALIFKLEQLQSVTIASYKHRCESHNFMEWEYADWLKLCMFANQIVSVMGVSELKVDAKLNFVFARKNGKMEKKEETYKRTFKTRFYKLIWTSKKLNIVQKYAFAFSIQHEDYSYLLIDEDIESGDQVSQ